MARLKPRDEPTSVSMLQAGGVCAPTAGCALGATALGVGVQLTMADHDPPSLILLPGSYEATAFAPLPFASALTPFLAGDNVRVTTTPSCNIFRASDPCVTTSLAS